MICHCQPAHPHIRLPVEFQVQLDQGRKEYTPKGGLKQNKTKQKGKEKKGKIQFIPPKLRYQ